MTVTKDTKVKYQKLIIQIEFRKGTSIINISNFLYEKIKVDRKITAFFSLIDFGESDEVEMIKTFYSIYARLFTK